MKIFKLIKRWINMLVGKSSFHVEQGIGKYYSSEEIRGYYNDLTNKVSNRTILDDDGIPINTTITNIETYFPISIFQYGLGLYDLYLKSNEDEYKKKFMKIVSWAEENIDLYGMWDCMGKLNDRCHKTQSSMCQSEGVSILLRGYVISKNKKYMVLAQKALDFMLKDIKDGGTTLYINDDVIFEEYVSDDNLSVLNGWIFSIFGLFDYTLISNEEKYRVILDKSLDTMCKYLKLYDRKYWSNYDLKGTIASPAYHDLHIRQLSILYSLFGRVEFKDFSEKWEKMQKSKINRYRAMFIKLKQKIFKNNLYDINTSLVK